MMDSPPLPHSILTPQSALSPPVWADDPELSPRPCDEATLTNELYRPVEFIRGDGRLPLVLSCPHAGRDYPQVMLEAAACSLDAMRGLEDFGVDQLVHGFAAEGVSCMVNQVARAYCDVNRPADALDAAMFAGPVDTATATSRHVKSGYGIIPKLTADRVPLYRNRLEAAEAATRIARVHTPYHTILSNELDQVRQHMDRAILLDLHSMPATDRLGRRLPDIVLGDCLGTTLNRPIANQIEQYFTEQGLSVAWNHPYAGGYITRQNGRQNSPIQSIQIEINRGLYMASARRIMDQDGTARMGDIMHGFAIHLANMCDGGLL